MLAETAVLASRRPDAPSNLDSQRALGASALEWSSHAIANLTEEEIRFTPCVCCVPRADTLAAALSYHSPALQSCAYQRAWTLTA